MPLARPDERKGSWIFPAEIIGSSDWLQSLWDNRDRLRGKKILVAWGMKDIGFREKELKTWMHAFPDAKVVRFEDAGHFIAEEKPDELIAGIKNLIRSQ
jgi:haloalkane dehalogenase